MLVRVDGKLPMGCTAKDVVLAIIGRIGTAGGTGYTIEFGGAVMHELSIEGRMTVCNMAIEAVTAQAWLPLMTRPSNTSRDGRSRQQDLNGNKPRPTGAPCAQTQALALMRPW